jgi:phosphoenolpyruvate phosphomutase
VAEGARKLRRLLARPEVVRLIGAHDALGARMAERAGFEGVWASGFEIAASYAVPDASIVTLSEHLAAARAMSQAAGLPVVADCDTGYGEALQFSYAVRQFEAAGVAGVCIEDKMFPKINSFAQGSQELLPVDDFVAKLRAGQGARQDPDFVIVARVEALIAGCGLGEALARARAYADAGADAVLVHSKAADVAEIAAVAGAWDRPVPLVAVPTTYFKASAQELASLGVKVVIYANHGLRAALRAMEDVYAEILRSGSTATVEGRLWPMKTIFGLQGVTPAPAVAAKVWEEEPWLAAAGRGGR